MSLGEKLKELRISNGYSIRELAQIAGVQYPLIWRYENDQVVPSLKTIKKLAFALEVDAKELIQLL